MIFHRTSSLPTLSGVLTLALGAASLAGQSQCPRPDVTLTQNLGQTRINSVRVASPQGAPLPGNPAAGLAPTARVAYAVWAEDTPSGDVDVNFLRSDDGGYSWDPTLTQTIWTTLPSEFLNTFSFTLTAEGNEVYLSFLTRRDNAGAVASDNVAWVLGSNDQGQTFQSVLVSSAQFTPTPAGVDLNRVLTVDSALSNGVLHVVFDADFDDDGTGISVNEDAPFYQSLSFGAGGTLVENFPLARNVQTVPVGTNDVDTSTIAADGNNVLITWEGSDNVESVVSNDGGVTFGSEVNHTGFPPGTGSAAGIDIPKNAVFGSTMVTVHSDSFVTPGSDDLLFASLSFDSGATFNTVQVSTGPDVQLPLFEVLLNANGLVIAWVDDASGDEELKVVSDTTGGTLLDLGLVSEQVLLSVPPGSGDDIDFTDIAARDAVFAITAREGPSTSQQTGFLFLSRDAGQTWETCAVNDIANGEVDDMNCGVSFNYDVNVGFLLDGAGSNTVVTGTKVGRLFDETATGGGIVYRGLPTETGGSCLYLISQLPPVSNAIQLPGLPGIALSFVPDQITTDTIFVPFFLRPITSGGTATLPIPNLAVLLGGPVYYLGLPFSSALLRTYTDPLEQT